MKNNLKDLDDNMLFLLVSEKVLAKDWFTEEEYEAWKDL